MIGRVVTDMIRRFSHSSDRDGTSPEKNGNYTNESVLCEIRSPSADGPDGQITTLTHDFGTWAARPLNEIGNDAANAFDDDDVEEEVPSNIVTVQPQPRTSVPNLDWMDFNDGDPTNLTGLLEEALAPTSHQLGRRVSVPSIRVLTPAIPDYEPCEVWRKANLIYARIFEFDRHRIAEADQVDSGSLVKVVKSGWDSLPLSERSNPIFEILREVDQYLFWDLDPVTKIANLYKSMLILKVSVSDWRVRGGRS